MDARVAAILADADVRNLLCRTGHSSIQDLEDKSAKENMEASAKIMEIKTSPRYKALLSRARTGDEQREFDALKLRIDTLERQIPPPAPKKKTIQHRAPADKPPPINPYLSRSTEKVENAKKNNHKIINLSAGVSISNREDVMRDIEDLGDFLG